MCPAAEIQPQPPEGGLVEWRLWRPPSVERFPVDLLTAEEKAAGAAAGAGPEGDGCRLRGGAGDRAGRGPPGLRRPAAGSSRCPATGCGAPVPGTSEFLPDELALVLNCARPFAPRCWPTPTSWSSGCRRCRPPRARGRLDCVPGAGVRRRARRRLGRGDRGRWCRRCCRWPPGCRRGSCGSRLIAAAMAADEEFAERRRIEAERRAAVRAVPDRRRHVGADHRAALGGRGGDVVGDRPGRAAGEDRR